MTEEDQQMKGLDISVCNVLKADLLISRDETGDDDVDQVVGARHGPAVCRNARPGSHRRLDFGSRSVQRYKPPDTSTTDTHHYQCGRG